MKILKIRLFSLLAVLAVSIFLISCEREEDGNKYEVSANANVVDSTPDYFYSQESFTDMIFEKFEKRIFFDEVFNIPEVKVVLNGKINVTENGTASGMTKLTSDAIKLDGQLSIERGIFTYNDSEVSIQINPFEFKFVHLNSSKQNSYEEISKELFVSLKSGRELSGEEKAVFSILSLSSTDQFLVNRGHAKRKISSQDIGNPKLRRDCSWWDKVVAGAIATALTATTGSGCAAAIAACAGGTVITLGGFAVPCIAIAGICGTTWGITWVMTYDWLLDNWLCEPCEPTTCLHQPPQVVYTNSAPVNNVVELSWFSVDGAQRYQVVQWVGYWVTLAETSNTSINIGGLAPGATYYFGVRTVCNDIATSDVTWTTVFN